MKVQLRGVMLGFQDIWKPKAVGDGKEKYSATFIALEDSVLRVKGSSGVKDFPLLDMDKEPKKRIMNILIGKVINEKWPGMKPGVRSKIKVWCWNKADGSTTREEYTNKEGEYHKGFDADTWYASAAKYPDRAPNGIQVLDQKRKPIDEASGKMFSGCIVNALLDIYPMERKDGNTINASLEGIQLVRRGEPLGFTETNAASEFDDEEMDESEEAVEDGDMDELFGGSGDDETPF